jgi:hypothetical protein
LYARFLFVCSIVDWTQGLVHYHFSCILSPFVFEIGSC